MELVSLPVLILHFFLTENIHETANAASHILLIMYAAKCRDQSGSVHVVLITTLKGGLKQELITEVDCRI